MVEFWIRIENIRYDIVSFRVSSPYFLVFIKCGCHFWSKLVLDLLDFEW